MTTPTIDDGGPAFPHQPAVDANGGYILYGDCGMTLRDWFAGQALIGLTVHNDFGARSDEEIAGGAYAYADAMIAARKLNTTSK